LDYGPFPFDLEDSTPPSDTLADITLRSFVGKVDIDDDIDDFTESTDELIDSVLTAVSGDYGIDAHFNYPTTAALQGEKHSLVFEITYTAGGTHNLYGQYVWVR